MLKAQNLESRVLKRQSAGQGSSIVLPKSQPTPKSCQEIFMHARIAAGTSAQTLSGIDGHFEIFDNSLQNVAIMPKSRKEKKPPIEIKPEYVLGENVPIPPPKIKKKQKNAPDRPQPTWMFPPDEENPVLNPRPKSDEKRKKNEEEKDVAIKFLRYKSVSAPMKDPPPDLLLTLVGSFLTSYGFDSTSRLYSTQLKSRKKLDEWKTQLDVKLPRGFPDLVKVFKDWYKVYQERTVMDETSSSSDSDDSLDTKPAKKVKKAKKAKAKASENGAAKVLVKSETSSSGDSDSSGGSDSDVEMKDATTTPKSKGKSKQTPRAKLSPSISTSSSDSDADDEKDSAGAKLDAPENSSKTVSSTISKTLKRKASASSSGSDSDSSSDSSAEEKPAPAKKLKSKAVKPSKPSLSSSSSSTDSESASPSEKPTGASAKSSTSSSDTSSSDEGSEKETKKSDGAPIAPKAVSSSSDTSSSSSDSEEVDFSQPPKPTRTSTSSPKQNFKSAQTPSDSSETLQATSTQKISTANTSISSTSTSSSDSATAPAAKRKRSASPTESKPEKQYKKQNTPFQRVPKDTQVDPKMASNAYRSYDYAERAHQDLSVTKGKGFTKEKNKKKRGSYKGGAIDVSGGKGIKFED